MKNRYGPNDVYFQMGLDYPTLRLKADFEKTLQPGTYEKGKKRELTTGTVAMATQSVASLF